MNDKGEKKTRGDDSVTVRLVAWLLCEILMLHDLHVHITHVNGYTSHVYFLVKVGYKLARWVGGPS